MKRLRKADQRKLQAQPRGLGIPCAQPVKQNKRRAADSPCGVLPAVLYEVRGGVASVLITLCRRHREQYLAHGIDLRVAPGLYQGQARAEVPRKTGLSIVPKAVAQTMEEKQKKVAEWAKLCFGEEHCANLPVRGLRLLEEAIEFAQAVGAPRDKCVSLVEYVYSRAVGNPLQELGGVGVTWLLAAEAYRVQAETAMDREIERVLAKPPSHFTERNQQKCEAGFGVASPGTPDRSQW